METTVYCSGDDGTLYLADELDETRDDPNYYTKYILTTPFSVTSPEQVTGMYGNLIEVLLVCGALRRA